MKGHWKLKLASLLFKHAYFLYKPVYFSFKNKKDKNHLELIRKNVKAGSVILDIGSNIGFFARFFSEVVGPKGLVYCFEPDTVNFTHLQKNLQGTNVSLIQKAVAKSSGKITLYPSPLLNVDHRTYASGHSGDGYEVEKISIDDFVGGKFKVDFIKMDIQGFETEAMMGMRKTVAENPEILIFMEFWPYGLQQAGSSAAELYDLVSETGLLVYKIDGKKVIRFSRNDALSMKTEYYTDCNVFLTRKVL
jgi:FkbM family methyltransferase